MNISDVRTNVDGLNKRSDLITRSAKLDDLTRFDTDAQSDGGSCEKLDPLIEALIDKLPKSNSVWLIEDRAKWIKAAAMAFDLIYKSGEHDAAIPKTDERAVGLKSAG